MVPQPPPDLQRAWREAIHAAGGRVTPQREALLAAVWRMRHATAESLAEELAGSDESISLSTVYRGLEALQSIGLVRHAHLGAGGPTYHISVEEPHIHLQCNTCLRVISVTPSVADDFVAAIASRTGFAADVTHSAIYGRCADCSATGEDGV